MADKNIVVDAQGDAEQHREPVASTSLVSWVMTRVGAWEDYRKQTFDDKWDEYYRLWRGIWKKEDSSRDSERSKIITPALAQAIESAVAELEEATFGSGKWFDVTDNHDDDNSADIQMFRDQLAEDFTKEDVESAISEIYLNGALYGTGIGKIVLEERVDRKIVPKAIGDTEITRADYEETNIVRVGLKAVHPKEFVIDPTARTVEDALGMAHITDVPKHQVEQKQTSGVYYDVQLSGYTDSIVGGRHETEKDNLKNIREEDQTLLVEYHGFVPRHMLEGVAVEMSDDPDNAETYVSQDDEELIEAIVTIANGNTLLRAINNPYVMGDRCFVAYQHDTVPNRFWGRGIAEKGYNPQKALDAEARGRIDAMALSIHPMMAMDASRMQRGQNFKVSPGRSILTNGAPRDILMPLNFGQVNPSTFNQSADLERQVQMGTGSMDSATPIADNQRNATSGGMSMIMGGAIKRSKRTLANIERRFTRPFINKSAWRYMQFAPDRYPVQDMEFNVQSTLGIVARELEQQSLANMMKTVPADSPAFWMLLKGIFEHSVISNREEMIQVIDAMMKQSLQKQLQPQQDPLVEIKKQEMQLKAQIDQAKLKIEQEENAQDAQIELNKLNLEYEKLRLKEREIQLEARIAAAQMEQDSAVTAAQMQTKFAEQQSKASKESESKTSDKPAVIHINNGGSGTRTVSVTRTKDGLEGKVEEV